MATKKELIAALDHTPTAIKQMALDMGARAVAAFNKVRAAIGGPASSLSAEFLGLGRACVTQAQGDFDKALGFFASATAGAESNMRTAFKQANSLTKLPTLGELLPAWQPAKSVINKAIEKKVDLANEKLYPTFTTVREAVKVSRTPGSGTGKTGASDSVGIPKVSEQLTAVIRSLVTAIAGLKDAGKEDAAAAILMPSVAQIEALSSGAVVTEEQRKMIKREALKRGGRKAA